MAVATPGTLLLYSRLFPETKEGAETMRNGTTVLYARQDFLTARPIKDVDVDNDTYLASFDVEHCTRTLATKRD